MSTRMSWIDFWRRWRTVAPPLQRRESPRAKNEKAARIGLGSRCGAARRLAMRDYRPPPTKSNEFGAAAVMLRRASAIVRAGNACALRLPRDAHLVAILALVGAEVVRDWDQGLAHIKPARALHSTTERLGGPR
jgi:hypothetical protein